MQRRCDRNDNGLSADEFNEHYTGISTDAGYESSCLKATVHDGEDIVSKSSIFYLLDHLHHTTTGYDELPAWFLRLTAPVYAGIIPRSGAPPVAVRGWCLSATVFSQFV